MFSNQLFGQEANQRFEEIVNRYFDESSKLNPIGATSMGDHRFDTEINDVSAAGRTRVARFYRDILTDLDSFATIDLSRDEQIDRALLQHRIRAAIWNQEELEEWAWNPLDNYLDVMGKYDLNGLGCFSMTADQIAAKGRTYQDVVYNARPYFGFRVVRHLTADHRPSRIAR